MAKNFPVVTIQSDWNDVLRLPNSKVWISSKYIEQNSVQDEVNTSANQADGKVKINAPANYEYVSHSNLSLVLKHVSGLKVGFVAPTKVHPVHSKAVLSVSAADNSMTLSSSEDDKLLVWDSRTSEILLDLKGHGGPVYKCRFFPSGIVVISVGADGSSRIWSAENGINPVVLKGHSMAIIDVAIVDKGKNVITVSRDGTAKLWDVGESNCLGNIIEGHGPINCCALGKTTDVLMVENDREVSTGDKVLVAGCESGLVVVAHVAKREELFSQQLDSACNACMVIEDSILIGCANGKIVQLNLQNGSKVNEWHESANPVLSFVALTNQTFIAGRQDGTCTVMSLQSAHEAVRVQLTGADCDGIRDLSFNGKWIFAACRDSKIRKYDCNQVIVHFK